MQLKYVEVSFAEWIWNLTAENRKIIEQTFLETLKSTRLLSATLMKGFPKVLIKDFLISFKEIKKSLN